MLIRRTGEPEEMLGSMMTAVVGGKPKVIGKRSAIAPTGPMPGSMLTMGADERAEEARRRLPARVATTRP